MVDIYVTDSAAIPCVQIDPHRFVGRMRVGMLIRLTSDPRQTELVKERAVSSRLSEAYSIRKQVQRDFSGSKGKNVPSFVQYLRDVHGGMDGLAPAIKLFCIGTVQIEDRPDGTAIAHLPLGREIVAYDGETQLAAWHALMAGPHDDTLPDVLVPVDISHGRTLEWARQVWHDVNLFGSRPNASLAISMDVRDPINKLADAIEHEIPFFDGQINKLRRSVRGGEGYLTLTTLRSGCLTFLKGISGLSYGAKPIPGLTTEQVAEIREPALDFFTGLAAGFGDQLSDPDSMMPAPSVFPAVCALGHSLLALPEAEQEDAIVTIMDGLRNVNWSRGTHWEGIAGKVSDGRLSIGGAKEYGYNSFKALSDRKSTIWT